MSKKISKKLIVPVITRAVTYAVATAALIMLWDKLVGKKLIPETRYCAQVAAGIFACAAWFIFLRCDGVGIPRLPKLSKLLKKIVYKGDVSSAICTVEENDEELTEAERDLCAMFACLLNAVFYLLVSFLT